MICDSCGNVVKDDDVYCLHCGALVNKVETQNVAPQKKNNGLAITSLVLGIFSWLSVGIYIGVWAAIIADFNSQPHEGWEGLGVLGLLLAALAYSFTLAIIPLINTIISGVCLGRRKKNPKQIPLAIAGLVLSAILLLVVIVVVIIVLFSMLVS